MLLPSGNDRESRAETRDPENSIVSPVNRPLGSLAISVRLLKRVRDIRKRLTNATVTDPETDGDSIRVVAISTAIYFI